MPFPGATSALAVAESVAMSMGLSFSWSRLPAHADALGALEGLALGLQRRCHHHLGLLELLQRLVTGGGHRGAKRTEEVEGAVVLVRRAHEDLGQRRPVARLHPCATRERRVEGGHAPVVSTAGRL